MNAETPQITTSNYGAVTASNLGINALARMSHGVAGKTMNLYADNPATEFDELDVFLNSETIMSPRRMVQIFIADPDINVPLTEALLYRGEPKFTDSTDQELYFEIPVADLLTKHNEKRKTWLDKDVSRKTGRDVFLEPAKIRDLKMVIVNIAQF